MDDDRPVATHSRNNNVVVAGTREIPPSKTGSDAGLVGNESPWETRYRESSCEGVDGATGCAYVYCPDPTQAGYIVEQRLRNSNQAWQVAGTTCIAPDGPVLTPGRILEEVRRIGLPSMSVEAPPETLVNYDTVVYTKAETFSRTVNLLGFTVDLKATPSQFQWSYGDGTTETTTTAGRPHPAMDITHTWDDAHRTFHPSVDVTYEIRFRVNGGEWQTLADTITIDGPEGDVRIREATGMLADMR